MKWQRIGRFWAGATCASLWSWLAFALTSAVMSLLYENFSWGQIFGLGFGFVSFIAIFYGAAIIATYFWAKVADNSGNNKKYAAWGTGTVMLILAPMVAVNPIGLLVVIISCPLAFWSFRSGMPSGEYFWKHRRWRHFFGLTNDYERESKDE